MYTCIHRVYMWEAEPRLYWRVKRNGKWTWVACVQPRQSPLEDCYFILPPEREVTESESE